jgi:hypothetical protein
MSLIQQAIDKHEKIYPCGSVTQLGDCFTMTGDKLFFWYNTEDDSTHLLMEEVMTDN